MSGPSPAVIPHRYAIAPINAARPHPKNPRRGDLEAIADSITHNGFFGAVIVQESTGFIIVGNHRWIAARDAGYAELPYLFVDVDDDRAMRIMVADNETANGARWNPSALAELLGGLLVTEAELAGTGFDAAKYARLANRWSGDPDPDDAGLAAPEPVSGPGDVWLLGRHRIICGDSTEPATLAALMGAELAGVMVTDPPYLRGYTGGNRPHMNVNRSVIADRLWDTEVSAEAGTVACRRFQRLSGIVPVLESTGKPHDFGGCDG